MSRKPTPSPAFPQAPWRGPTATGPARSATTRPITQSAGRHSSISPTVFPSLVTTTLNRCLTRGRRWRRRSDGIRASAAEHRDARRPASPGFTCRPWRE